MSSLPSAIVFGSYASGSVRDVIQSYRRAQTYLSASISASAASDIQESETGTIDEENAIDIEDTGYEADSQYGDIVGNLDFDEDLVPGPSRGYTRQSIQPHRYPFQLSTVPTPTTPEAEERTPLLPKTASLSFLEASRPSPDAEATSAPKTTPAPVTITRRTSQLSARSYTGDHRLSTGKAAKYIPLGQSTFGQTLFNAIAILLGIGLLSEPLAFAYAGWIGGLSIIVGYGFITCYTAKILAHIVLSDPRLRSYSDIGAKAFGPRSGPFISALFCLELFTVSVALVTLFADSLHAVMPSYSTDTYKIMGLIVLVPTMLLPLSVLSYASIIGILSVFLIIMVVLVDGFSKRDSPGSLWSPADTSLGVSNFGELGIAFGLFMAGFSGHAVIPSLVRDMVDPAQFDTMIDYAFGVATAIYATIGVAGYLMFGNSVSDEFSKDIVKIPGYNPALNQIALWGLVLSPLSKYALATRPLNITLEIMLGIDPGYSGTEDHNIKPSTQPVAKSAVVRSTALSGALVVTERTVFTVLSVMVSILVPEFSSMMAFLGAFCSFALCVIGPVSAKVAMARHCKWWDALLLAGASIMAIWGTGAAFWSVT